jgi:hypothetical protein
MSAGKKLSEMTYVVEHNPNCAFPYLVRLVGPGSGGLDKLPPGQTKDVLGYGTTVEKAAGQAFEKLEVLEKNYRPKFWVVHPGR